VAPAPAGERDTAAASDGDARADDAPRSLPPGTPPAP
jgi:hypothetical protein